MRTTRSKKLALLVASLGLLAATEPSTTRAHPESIDVFERALPHELASGALRVMAPSRASVRLHVERSSDAYLDIEAIGARDAIGRTTNAGSISYPDAFEATEVVHLAASGRTEEIRHVTHRIAAPSPRYRVSLGPAFSRLRVVDELVEALDARDVALLRTEPAFVVDADGRRRAMHPSVTRANDGAWSLTFALDDTGLRYPLDIDPAWTLTTSLAHARRDDTLQLLSSGKVLAMGGQAVTGAALSSVESWDPTTGSWTSAGSLLTGRAYHQSLLLPSGSIVSIGGYGGTGGADVGSSAELFDPATGTSKAIAADAPAYIGFYPRLALFTPTVLLVLGQGSSALLDVSTGVWTSTPYVQARQYTSGALLSPTKLLMAGGATWDTATTSLSSAELFDFATKKWSSVAPMKTARTGPEVRPLPSGAILVAGGAGLSTAEIYDPTKNSWTATPPMSTQHSFGASVVLADHRVLMLAGDLDDGLTDATDLYDPTSNSWSFAGHLASPRDEFGYALLSSGKVMIAGGSNGSPVPLVEIFSPLSAGQACAGAGECTSGFCVDGFCCGTSSCASGQTCAGPGTPGTCLAIEGAKCVADAECGSAHCVDGVCCSSACTDPCGACDVAGSVGTCVAVAAGDAPHGARGACPGSDACRARCGGVETTKCTQFPGTAIACGAPSCSADEQSSARGCNAAGSCAPATTRACAPYACGATACKTTCAADTDCVDGNTCDLVTRACVVAATCDGDHTVTSPSGEQKDCTPFRCGGARCLDACTDSSACAAGFLCDSATHRCEASASSGAGSSGGCVVGERPSHGTHGTLGGLVSIVGLGAALVMARARRR